MFLAVLLLGAGAGGCSEPKTTASTDTGGGRNAIVQLPFDQAAKIVMLQIGKAYEIGLLSTGPPQNARDLGANLFTNRDLKKRDVEVVYGVDPKRLPNGGQDHRLAWEKEATRDGCRMVLMADCQTVKYLNQDEFDKTPKAK